MGALYDAVKRVDEIIKRKGLDSFETRGKISLQAGFFVALVREDDADDAAKLEALRSAVEQILGESAGF